MRAEVRSLAKRERVLASVIEAVLGACYIEYGYERTAEAAVEAFTQEIEEALGGSVDYKSTLQEVLAQDGMTVRYRVARQRGPAHARKFEVVAVVGDEEAGRGIGPSKKAAEQEAAHAALTAIGGHEQNAP
jgi:ribonuclease-3